MSINLGKTSTDYMNVQAGRLMDDNKMSVYAYNGTTSVIHDTHFIRFGAFMNVYLISCVTPLFKMMQKYEKAGYLKVQPWHRVNFPYVPSGVADPFLGIEFQNQAAAHTDCLLQYKESAEFVMFLDIDNILIPKVAPTYVKEFQLIAASKDRLAYLVYPQENYEVIVPRKGAKFSAEYIINSMKYEGNTENQGKVIASTKHINYTWIYSTPYSNGNDFYKVTENSITHLDVIKSSYFHEYNTKAKYLNSSNALISVEDIQQITSDFQEMTQRYRLNEILPDLPERHHYSISLSKCLYNSYYKHLKNNDFGKVRCPGLQVCHFEKIPGSICVHVNATHVYMLPKFPITYYYASDPHFTSDIGCTPQ